MRSSRRNALMVVGTAGRVQLKYTSRAYMINPKDIKRGTELLIVRKMRPGEMPESFQWVREMDKAIGTIGIAASRPTTTVLTRNATPDRVWLKCLNGSTYYFPLCCLAPIDNESIYKKETNGTTGEI